MKTKPGRGWVPVAVLVAAGVGALLPAAVSGVPDGADLRHHYRVALSLHESLGGGNFYPGLVAWSNGGFGDFSLRFYPPVLYYLLAASRALAGSWYAGSLLLFALLSAAGCVGVYVWAREFVGRGAAAWGGALYAFVPFHLNDLYNAAFLGQYAAGAALPFAFAFTERVARGEGARARDVAGLAASFALLVLTHLPLAVIGSLSLLLYALLRVRWRAHGLEKTLARLASGVLLGLAASAFFWATMLAEKSWVRIGTRRAGAWADYGRNFLFQTTVYPETVGVLWVNVVAVAMLAMFLPAFVLWRGRRGLDEKSAGGAKTVAVLLVFSFVMATPLSRPAWDAFGPLREVQFPWRWLAVASPAGPLLLALSVPLWAEKLREHGRAMGASVVAALVVLVALATSFVLRDADYLPRAKFDARLAELPGSDSLSDWFPAWAGETAPRMNTEVEAAGREVLIEEWAAERRTFRVAAGATTDARVRAFYYPHWLATDARGRQLPTRADGDGALLVSLAPEAATVTLEFREPRLSMLAGAASALGWLLILALFFYGRARPRPRRTTAETALPS